MLHQKRILLHFFYKKKFYFKWNIIKQWIPWNLTFAISISKSTISFISLEAVDSSAPKMTAISWAYFSYASNFRSFLPLRSIPCLVIQAEVGRSYFQKYILVIWICNHLWLAWIYFILKKKAGKSQASALMNIVKQM